ncbi:AAA family ATPase [Terrimonas sp. NA20]|uniref:AAA family ATPase n=1 Tax=Terrimonas ginsenosidimutans TaxID=2908004 RepID=A0ABS9KK39_9BACT|nr:AAA family ATPase [Terrimonas ginsenosidimutans]MCG2612679.1 AAA family ATPase [Terrimonas ginsenosidimutans]
MIKIKRTPAPPGFMTSSVIIKLKTELRNYYKKPQHTRRQTRPPSIPLPQSVLEKIRTYLLAEFNGKCAYCESKISMINIGDFDHFRPKSSARGLNDEFSLDHYWTLAFDWRNMYLSCEVCSRYKVNWFPVEGKRAKLTQTFIQIRKSEKNLLIDPCFEDPFLHLSYKENGMAIPLTHKGEVTIDILKLNRKALVEQRRRICQEFINLIRGLEKGMLSSSKTDTTRLHMSALVEELLIRISEVIKVKSTLPFLGIQKFYLQEYLRKNSKLAEMLQTIDGGGILNQFMRKTGIISRKQPVSQLVTNKKITDISIATSFLNRFSIKSIEIENFKCIERLTLQFPKGGGRREPWLMLLGENGVGKSSFLQALTLTLMGEEYLRKMKVKPTEVLRNGADSGFVRIQQEDQITVELHFTRSLIQCNERKPPTFLLAYGATRLFPTKNIKPEYTKGQVRARNMFNPATALFADNWLLSLYEKNKEQFDFACRALKSLLAKEIEDPDLTISVHQNDVLIHYSDQRKHPDKLDTLSDGYKSVIALACDMMQALMTGNSTMEVVEGIVIIDEIGTHLHPRWKMRIVNSLRTAFPRLQFIVTTHDPLCLKGLTAGEIAVFKKNDQGQIYAIGDLPNPDEFRADQLLTSRFFGLNSTIDEKLEKDFDEYYQLLARQGRLTIRQKKRLNLLKEALRGKDHLGHSLREELAFTAVDTILAKEKADQNTLSESNLKDTTIALLQKWWDEPLEIQQKIINA